VLVALSGWLMCLLVIRARANSFWHDEVYTILLARMPLATFWRASLDGVDFSAPLNSILTHVVVSVMGVGELTVRLPPIAGILAASVFLFLAVGRRTNGVVGLFAALLPCSTEGWGYALQARGYGLTLGLFALALYAWSEAAAGRRSAMHWAVTAAALTAAMWTHYYAVLMWVPIVAGEGVRQAVRGFQAGPWIALACAAAGALPLWPLIAAAAAHRSTFWAHPQDQTITGLYRYALGGIFSLLASVSVFGLLIAARWLDRRPAGRTRRLEPHDFAAILGCFAIPALGLGLGYATHAFTPRYIAFATVGMAFAISELLWWSLPSNGLGDLLAVSVTLWPPAALTARMIHDPPVLHHPLDDHPVLADWLKGSTPVVLTGGLDYLGLWYSLPARERRYTVYLADPAAEMAAHSSDTVERGYLTLGRWTPIAVAPFGAFVGTHRHFWLYSYDDAWQEARLRQLNAILIERVREPTGRGVLYEVSLP
jgi:hypothetical protein